MTKRTLVRFAAGIILAGMVSAVTAQEQVYLWPKKTAPGSEKISVKNEIIERSTDPAKKNRAETGITRPYFSVYKPEQANGTAILIAPGGAYARVVIDKEGADIASFYNSEGITVFVLSYRLPSDNHRNNSMVPLADAQRAIRIIRNRAAEWNVDPDRIGVMGFSAGGHVAASLGTKYETVAYEKIDAVDDISAKPNFMLLIYPVITMKNPYAHAGSRKALLGEQPAEETMAEWSLESCVTRKTPKTFIALAGDDKSVAPIGNGIAFQQACAAKMVAAELHVFPASGHGFGIDGATGTAANWPALSITWLKSINRL